MESEDIVQANNLPSVRTARGHQGPAAFLILASGLDKVGFVYFANRILSKKASKLDK